MTWTPLTLSQARGEITFYQIVYEPTNGVERAINVTVPGTDNSVILRGLRADSKYRVSVSAVTRLGVGPATTITEPGIHRIYVYDTEHIKIVAFNTCFHCLQHEFKIFL